MEKLIGLILMFVAFYIVLGTFLVVCNYVGMNSPVDCDDKKKSNANYFTKFKNFCFAGVVRFFQFGMSLAITGVLIFVFIGAFNRATNQYTCLGYKTISKIGGCNAFGNCGVMYDDGTVGEESKPVTNSQVCVEKTFH